MNNHHAPWTPEMDAELTAAWQTTDTAREIAERFGRTRNSLFERASRLGLPGKPYLHVNDSAREQGKIYATENRDEAHVAACKAQGGFWAFSERRFGRNGIAVCLPLLPPSVQA